MFLRKVSLVHRRRLCRVLFLTCGLLPVLVVAAWATWRVNRQGPSYYARQLSDILGAEVTARQVVPLRPGAYEVRGVKLSDLETHRTIGTCRSVMMVQGPGGAAVQVSQLELAGDQIAPLWHHLHRLLVDRDAHSPSVFVSIDNIRIMSVDNQIVRQGEAGVEPVQLSGQLRFSQQADGPELRATWIWDRGDESDACHVRVLRHRRGERPVTRVAVTTGETPVRCDLLPDVVSWLQDLGPRATFRGAVWMQNESDVSSPSGGGWRGEVTGVLGNVDLERLAKAHLSHPLTGTAEIAIDTCRFEESRISQWDAVVKAGPGLVSQSLLDAMVRHLGAVPRGSGSNAVVSDSTATRSTDPVRPYQQLAMQVHLLPQGVALRGRCSDQRPGTLVSDTAGPLLCEPVTQPHSVASLLTALAPDGADKAPVNRTAQRLMQWLPLPLK